MSENTENISERPGDLSDGLSAILSRIGLTAEMFIRADLCGAWAVDTSGYRKSAFHLIEQGSGWLHSGDSDSPRPLSSGDFVIFPHDAPHCVSSGPERPPKELINQLPGTLEGEITTVLCGFFVFHNRNAWPLLDGLPEVIVLKLMRDGRRNSAYFLLQLMLDELESDKPGRGAALNQLAQLLFIRVIRSQMNSRLGEGLLPALAHQQIGRALNAMHLRFQEDWTVNKLAGQAGMSRSVFSEQFAGLVHKTPMRYLAEWRMQEASNLLRETNVSMAAIANRVGYASEIAFRKAFRKIVGKTPGEVRRQR